MSSPSRAAAYREVHRLGNEQAWWLANGIDPLSVAQKLWNNTRVKKGRIEAEAQLPSTEASPPDDPAAKSSKKGSKEAPPETAQWEPHGARVTPGHGGCHGSLPADGLCRAVPHCRRHGFYGPVESTVTARLGRSAADVFGVPAAELLQLPKREFSRI